MKIEIIGRGNVATQMGRIFGVTPVSSRSLEGMSVDADLYMIAVSDSAVEEVAMHFPEVKGIVVHTTGSVSLDVLNHICCKGHGVMYPFQTISKRRALNASDIPLLIEADKSETADFIITTASEFGFQKIGMADGEKRRRVHLAGTFACNFTNAMIGISQKILSECGIEPDIVKPLIHETFEKLKTLPANQAQTGPAIRKDFATMQKHLRLLEALALEKEWKIYKDVSEYILKLSKLITES